jgi:hypothetical protein
VLEVLVLGWADPPQAAVARMPAACGGTPTLAEIELRRLQ